MIPHRRRKALFTKLESSLKRLLSPVARIKLQRMLQDGFPPELHSPLLYLFTGRTGQDEQILFERIESLRKSSANGETQLQVLRGAAGPTGANGAIYATRELDWLREIVSMPRYWGTFLHLCANATKARTILELGCCIGISGCYMASGKSCVEFITIEGSSDLVPIAESNLRGIVDRFRIIPALFEEGLDMVLPNLSHPLDLVHIDGDHTEEMALHYFRRLIPHLSAGSVVLFDDIHFSSSMWSAWKKLCRWNGASFTVNLGRFGMLVWEGDNREPQTYDLSAFACEWGKGHAGAVK